METWKLIIADNHPIARFGIRWGLEADLGFEIIAEVSTGKACIEQCNRLQPDIILMDINMPNGNGVETTQTIHRNYPHILVIACSAFPHHELQREMMLAGAVGFISKEIALSDIPDTIRGIIDKTACPSLTFRKTFHLTKKELVTFIMLVEGKNRLDMSHALGISINTLKMHLKNLYRKIGVSNSEDAIKLALEKHLL